MFPDISLLQNHVHTKHLEIQTRGIISDIRKSGDCAVKVSKMLRFQT